MKIDIDRLNFTEKDYRKAIKDLPKEQQEYITILYKYFNNNKNFNNNLEVLLRDDLDEINEEFYFLLDIEKIKEEYGDTWIKRLIYFYLCEEEYLDKVYKEYKNG